MFHLKTFLYRLNNKILQSNRSMGPGSKKETEETLVYLSNYCLLHQNSFFFAFFMFSQCNCFGYIVHAEYKHKMEKKQVNCIILYFLSHLIRLIV